MSTVLFKSPLNSTIIEENLLLSTTTPSTTSSAYDHQGAAIYIAVILVWYSTGLAMMLFLQVRPRTLQQQFLLDPANSSRRDHIKKAAANPFRNYRDIQADHATKQILNELKDPERRQRLWRIYYGSPDIESEPYEKYYQTMSSDSATIDRIKRKLADIHRIDSTEQHDTHASSTLHPVPSNEHRLSIPGLETSKFFPKRFSIRRPTHHNSLFPARLTTHRGQTQNDSHATHHGVEMEPLVDKKPVLAVPANNPIPQQRGSLDRFTVEKVSDDNITTNISINVDTAE